MGERYEVIKIVFGCGFVVKIPKLLNSCLRHSKQPVTKGEGVYNIIIVLVLISTRFFGKVNRSKWQVCEIEPLGNMISKYYLSLDVLKYMRLTIN